MLCDKLTKDRTVLIEKKNNEKNITYKRLGTETILKGKKQYYDWYLQVKYFLFIKKNRKGRIVQIYKKKWSNEMMMSIF
jgi:hypothetical protein